METKTWPLESIGYQCSTCKLGRLKEMGPTQEPEPSLRMPTRLVPQKRKQVELTCNYCGVVTIIDDEILGGSLKRSREYT